MAISLRTYAKRKINVPYFKFPMQSFYLFKSEQEENTTKVVNQISKKFSYCQQIVNFPFITLNLPFEASRFK